MCADRALAQGFRVLWQEASVPPQSFKAGLFRKYPNSQTHPVLRTPLSMKNREGNSQIKCALRHFLYIRTGKH
jgi:hypothetical protein